MDPNGLATTPASSGLADAARLADELLQEVPDAAVYVFGPDLVLRHAAGPAMERAGLAGEHLVGRAVPDVVPREAWEAVGPHYMAALEGEARTFTFESERLGRVYWVQARPVRGSGDDVAGAVVLSRELANLRDGLAASLPLSLEQLCHAVTASPAPAMLSSISGRCLIANEPCAQLLGRSVDDLAGQGIDDLVHPDDRGRACSDVWHLLDGAPRLPQAEMRHVRPDGETVTTAVNTMLLRDADGRPRFLYTQMLDVSERRRHQEQVERRLRRQSAVAALGVRAVSGEVTLPELIEDGVRLARETLGIDHAYVAELVEDEQLLVRAGPAETLSGRRFPVAGSLLEHVLALREPVVTNDVGGELGVVPPALAELAARSAACVLVGRPAEPFGGIVALASRPFAFHGDEVDFLQTVANILAEAIRRERLQATARHQAMHDSVTGLPNRALLDDRLSQALAAGRRVGGLVGVLFVDLDHFKVVNDSLGHPAGDEVLRAVAARLREAVPESDTVARFGGDEFVVVSSGLRDDGDATRIADRLLAALDGPIAIGGEEQHVRASIGVCVADPRTHTDHATLLRDADTAMHRAKERGRGRYELLDEATRRRARERLTVENELRRGLELGEVQPFFQPLVRLRDGSAYGAEALVRWQHPVRGPLGPGAFLDVAEHSGLIVPLGASILREACMHAARWNAEREEPLALTVNLSPRQLVDPDLVGTVSEALAAGNLDPRQLGLEITEQALMRDEQQVLDTLTALKQLGVQLLLDDFGTGFSSLSHLKRFPIDAVKIDRSFVAGLGDDGGEDAAIVSAILAMSWATGKRVVAEGIETSEHVARLCRLRCELGQGYHFAEPLAPADFEAWLAAGAARTGCCADEEPRAQTAPFGAGESFAGAARRLVSMLHHRLPGSAVWIGRLHDVAGVVRIVAADGDSSFGLDAGTELPLEGRPETVGGRPVGSFVGQPLTVDGRTVGSIGAISRERNAFAEQDAELLAVAAAALAGHLAALARGCAPASEPLTDAVARA